MVQQNISSLLKTSPVNAFEQVKGMLLNETLDIDVLLLSETWLETRDPSVALCIPGYVLFRNDRRRAIPPDAPHGLPVEQTTNGRNIHGGTAIYARASLKLKLVSALARAALGCEYQQMSIEIKLSQGKTLGMCCGHRPPNTCTPALLDCWI